MGAIEKVLKSRKCFDFDKHCSVERFDLAILHMTTNVCFDPEEVWARHYDVTLVWNVTGTHAVKPDLVLSFSSDESGNELPIAVRAALLAALK